MKRITPPGVLGLMLLAVSSHPVPGAEADPAPPPGRPSREELRERVRNLTPEERETRLREFRERSGPGLAASREEVDRRRREWEKLREEIKGLPPAQREAKKKEFREKGGLPRPAFDVLGPEEREIKRKEFRERVDKDISELRKKQADGKATDDDARRLQRMEMISKRLATSLGNRPGNLPAPRP